MSEGAKIPIEMADKIAERFIAYIGHRCKKVSVAGSVRRRCAEVGDIEIVCVPVDEFAMGHAFPEGFQGMVVNGSRLKRFKYPKSGIQIELYITNEADFGRIFAIRTGSSAFSHHLAVRWGRLGWAGTEDGLRRKKECVRKSTWKIKPEYKAVPTKPPEFDTEEKFFAFLGVEWIPPIQRNWVSKLPEHNYSV